jgi:hypothetical protein
MVRKLVGVLLMVALLATLADVALVSKPALAQQAGGARSVWGQVGHENAKARSGLRSATKSRKHETIHGVDARGL